MTSLQNENYRSSVFTKNQFIKYLFILKEWLDVMNTSSNSINELENEFQKLLKNFHKSKKKALLLLEETNKSLGTKIVRKARKYYEAIREIEAVSFIFSIYPIEFNHIIQYLPF